ncbi:MULTISPECIES: DNA-processing protein DprA [Actinotignum]|uniref:DNA protecting protein DprA n=2 Tax=Actinomycetaceae TaxID=2049 RepID=S2VKC0_9ACTO|nr:MULTISPECIES: DNA-processing protein DprA [Actinotignum]MDE1653912.1 DNA-protecting protein DprA [Actinotignum schaalii]EPD27241.1 DNA protecting protein DprA [Actinotignum schaalii FB123-CNA-2]MDY5128111.1 DNA-processing protein DprA [Actinotignum sp. SLA_B059]MDY5137407.1 DNA-processing protein DprA [Actinotignum sanguinis]MDY5144988.1 DNA-processing protein DprA [Actinotignum timonense]
MSQLVDILALARKTNKKITQPVRLATLLYEGIDAALMEVDPGALQPCQLEREQAAHDIATWNERGINILSVVDHDYPQYLAQVREAPLLIYYEGKIEPVDRAVAIVGSRQATREDCERARVIAHLMVEQGYSVASGLARGIDTAAHEGTLEATGRTIAVMGTGIDITYPPENTQLRSRIVESGGLVLTQFEPGAPPTKVSFPMRNATMSGYSQATIVVAAGEYSGTRNQVRAALAHGRSVILLAPVVRETQWARKLVGNPGVYIASSMKDIREALESIARAYNLFALT